MNVFMKKILIVCSFLSMLLLIACGGGGGGGSGGQGAGASQIVAKTVSIVDVSTLTPALTLPEFITRSIDGYLYVTDATSNLRKINLNGGTNTTLITVGSATGIGLSGAGNLYYLANHNIYLYSAGTPTSIYADGSSIFAGMVFSGNNLYVADRSSILRIPGVAVGSTYFPPLTNILLQTVAAHPAAPIGLAVDATNIYATLDNGSVIFFPLGNTLTLPNSANTWSAGFSNPKGVVVVGNYAYVVNYGTTGDDGFISKVDLNSGGSFGTVSTFMDSTNNGNWPAGRVGFCGPYGITADPDGSYVYVTNQTCTSNTVNSNSILKIKL